MILTGEIKSFKSSLLCCLFLGQTEAETARRSRLAGGVWWDVTDQTALSWTGSEKQEVNRQRVQTEAEETGLHVVSVLSPELFLQHLVVTEVLLPVFVSILATSSLRESPDDRINSLPLEGKDQTSREIRDRFIIH